MLLLGAKSSASEKVSAAGTPNPSRIKNPPLPADSSEEPRIKKTPPLVSRKPLEVTAKAKTEFQLKENDVIALAGGSNIERTRFNGWLQTHLIASKPDGKIRVRNFGWEGDTVFEQWRDAGAAGSSDSWRQQREWKLQLREAGATVVLAQFGQMESLGGRQSCLNSSQHTKS